MNRQAILIAALFLFILPAVQTQGKPDDNAAGPTIAITKLDVTDKTLRLAYQIRNTLNQDIWICDSICRQCGFEVYLGDDGKALVIRKRLDVPSSTDWFAVPFGKYVRLGVGRKRDESVLLEIPVSSILAYSDPRKEFEHAVNATRLSVEIGYCVGDLPETYVATAEGRRTSPAGELSVPNTGLGTAQSFTGDNESLNPRDEQVLIPYTYPDIQRERALVATVDDVNIPYKETPTGPEYAPPDLVACTRVKVRYEPSLLEYFYPYKSQQCLLNEQERKHLRSQKSAVIDSAEDISSFANELGKTRKPGGGIVWEKSKAVVAGYQDGKRVVLFTVYDDTTIETERNQRIQYTDGLKSLRKLTPQIQPFELRMQCAANLKNLWYRLRFYDRAEKYRVQARNNLKLDDTSRLPAPKITRETGLFSKGMREMLRRDAESFRKSRARQKEVVYVNIDPIYPEPRRWCDALELAFAGWSKTPWHDSKMKAHVCPGVAGGRSSYAMNRYCKYDSPADMVLLFEAKAGWNQHGGPELFTFDNHDPKGGCVLLNDGTVKFIRTTKELRQLRWK
jgi:hypothetical protein